MSKPDSSGAKSLEEILASIRNSLADEGSDRPAEPRLAPAKAAQPEPKPELKREPKLELRPEPKLASNGDAAGNGAGLSSKLAGALNGAAGGPAHDDDLDELLAAEPTKPVLSVPADQAKPSEANGKDPLWFLTRLSAAAAGRSAAPGPAARARDAAKAPAPPVAEEVKLSRPEVLRASLPPLFGAGETAPAAKASSDAAPLQAKAADSMGPTARTEPRGLPSLGGDGEAGASPDKGKAGPNGAAAAPEAAPVAAPFATLPEQKAAEAEPSEAPEPFFLSLDAAPAGGRVAPYPLAEAKPAVMPSADAVPDRVPQPADSAAAEPAGGLQTQALEQMVAQMLEPVIRQWLQSNLPRMIETVVREEAARAVAAERGATKA